MIYAIGYIPKPGDMIRFKKEIPFSTRNSLKREKKYCKEFQNAYKKFKTSQSQTDKLDYEQKFLKYSSILNKNIILDPQESVVILRVQERGDRLDLVFLHEGEFKCSVDVYPHNIELVE